MKKYQFVLQWPARSIGDYDALVGLEDQLTQIMPEGSDVDGHDAGSGQMNIFIFTDAPEKLFKLVKPVLAESDRLDAARVAFREVSKSDYTILWPKNLKVFQVS